MRALVGIAMAAVGCGRVGFEARTDGGTRGGSDAPVGAHCTAPSTGSCGTSSPFKRVQVVPSTCPQGTMCEVMTNTSSQSQMIVESAHDLLVAFVYAGQHPMGTPGGTAPNLTLTLSDTLGNKFLPGPFTNNDRYDDSAVQIFFAPDIVGGTNIVSVASTAPQTENFWTGLALAEYSGVATTDVVDISTVLAKPSSSTTSASAPAMTMRTECDLVVGGMTNGHALGSADTAGPGWTMPFLDEWCPAGYVDDVTTGTSLGASASIQIAFDNGPDDGWAATQMAFRAASSTPPCQPTSLAFTSAPQSITHGTCSGEVTLTALAGDASTITSSGLELALVAQGVTFYADQACAFPITTALIGAGTAATSLYYIAPGTGSFTLTATGDGFTASQTETSL